jgi:hypothetical protein
MVSILFYTQQAEQQPLKHSVQIPKAIEVFPVGITFAVTESVQARQGAGSTLGQVLLLALY